jgi:hypothetical protein
MKVLLSLTSILITLPITVCASYPDEVAPKNIADFHYPKIGVMVVPPSELQIPEDQKIKIQSNMLQMKAKGYYDSDAPDAKNLLAMKNVKLVALQAKQSGKPNDPQDTNLKSSIADVGLSYNYSGIAFIPKQNVIGYAAGGIWIDNKGWTDIKEFFNDPELGVCTFTLHNMVSFHGNVRIGEDSVRYDVNKKPGTVSVYGNNTSGFTYNVSWYDNTYDHELECAQNTYNRTTLSKMIAYSNIIDKDLSKKLY